MKGIRKWDVESVRERCVFYLFLCSSLAHFRSHFPSRARGYENGVFLEGNFSAFGRPGPDNENCKLRLEIREKDQIKLWKKIAVLVFFFHNLICNCLFPISYFQSTVFISLLARRLPKSEFLGLLGVFFPWERVLEKDSPKMDQELKEDFVAAWRILSFPSPILSYLIFW